MVVLAVETSRRNSHGWHTRPSPEILFAAFGADPDISA